MRKIIVTEFVTLDGVAGEPQNWSFPYWNDAIGDFKQNELFTTGPQLLGRVTYEGFAAAWPEREGEYADRLNGVEKYVVSTTLESAAWNNSHVIGGDVAEEVRKLKEQDGPDLLVHGSLTLVQSLIMHGLVDQFNLLVYPLVLGGGKRLFWEGSSAKLKLAETRAFDTGVVLFQYEPIETE
jgi:dihydrofolate reductase